MSPVPLHQVDLAEIRKKLKTTNMVNFAKMNYILRNKEVKQFRLSRLPSMTILTVLLVQQTPFMKLKNATVRKLVRVNL